MRNGVRSFVPREVHAPGGFGYMARESQGLPPLDLPREVAGYEVLMDGSFRDVTWREIHAARTERQRQRLEWKRRGPELWVRPAQLWVFEVPGWLFAGWWCYIRSRVAEGRYDELRSGCLKGAVGQGSDLALDLMRRIPCGVLALHENWTAWMEAFAKQHPKKRTKSDPRPAGILNGWTEGRGFYLTKEQAQGEMIL